MMKTIIGASIGDCVHVAGIHGFLDLARSLGYRALSLGPAVPIEQVIDAIEEHRPDLVAISYRLSPQAGGEVLDAFKRRVREEGLDRPRYLLGALPELVERERDGGFFEEYFVGGEHEKALAILRGEGEDAMHTEYLQDVVSRMAHADGPLLRAHFGQPTLEATIAGIERIAHERVLDVISLGPDQNAQAHFFHPERMSAEEGAGGVPIRTADDLRRIYSASRQGNFPLLRSYAGTDEFTRFAQLYAETINNAWSAVPIYWFCQLDGRGPHTLRDAIEGHLDLIRWNVQHDLPVEILESHHWSMRDAPDEVAVAAGVLGARICKELGVRHFIGQYMFNTPRATSARDDLAKMLAQRELIEDLRDANFTPYVQTRAGLVSYPVDLNESKGQLAASTYLQMQMDPDIVHVVTHSEGDHAASAEDIIESSAIARRVIANARMGVPDMRFDPYIIEAKERIKRDARGILDRIDAMGSVLDAENLERAVRERIFFAPQLDQYGGAR